MHIAIAGNIGSGKTTLTELLAKQFNWDAKYESVEDNPYLDNFYSDMKRWSFNLQVFFLNSRLHQIKSFRESEKSIIQDRTIYEDAEIFAKNLHTIGNMTDRDYDTYKDLFQSMIQFVEAPNLLIYLRASVPTLVNNIQNRGRSYENTIRIDYLQQLNEHYEEWINGYSDGDLLIVDVDNTDFLNNPSDLRNVVDKIEAQLNGLF